MKWLVRGGGVWSSGRAKGSGEGGRVLVGGVTDSPFKGNQEELL